MHRSTRQTRRQDRRRTKRLIRIREVCQRTGLAKSTVHEHVARGLMPPAIKISRSWGAWWDREIDQLVGARIAGFTNDQIRELVTRLVAERPHAAPRDEPVPIERPAR